MWRALADAGINIALAVAWARGTGWSLHDEVKQPASHGLLQSMM